MLAAALVLAALPAAAELAVYDAGKDPGQGVVWSGDGYHYAFFESSGGEDRWIVDGKVRARGAEGTLGGPAALSRDGRVLLHPIAVFDDKGNPLGVAPAVNGRRAGAPVEEFAMPAVSPLGGNVAFAARTAAGWVVRSQRGSGPVFADPPLALEVGEKDVTFIGANKDAVWLCRDHKTVASKPWAQASLSPGGARSGGVYEGSDGSIRVEVDGREYGPYSLAAPPSFSADGRHFAFLAAGPQSGGNSYDLLVVDGVERPMHQCAGCAAWVDGRGRAFQDVTHTAISERGQIHSAYLDGVSLGGQTQKVGFGGGHYVAPMLSKRGPAVVVDGALTEPDAPLPLAPAPVSFDGPDEYHYWAADSGKLLLVCGNAAGPRAAKTRCDSAARAAGFTSRRK